LDRHLIAEQVELADRTAEFAQLHLAGPQATRLLEAALGDDVPVLDELLHMERTFGGRATAHVRRHDPLGWPGYDIVCLNARAGEIWQALARAGAKPAGGEAYNVLRVETGTPAYGVDVDDKRFAMELGRTERAISFTKGCYLGQEPIVMARDRAGHAPRLLVGLKLPGIVPSGSKLFRDAAEIGWVTSAVVSPRAGGPVGLGYVRYASHEPGQRLEVETANGREPAEVASLPMVKSG
jgi:folate-binding protein YgfZ